MIKSTKFPNMSDATPTFKVDESSRIDLPVKLLKWILGSVIVGAFMAGWVAMQNKHTQDEVLEMKALLSAMNSKLSERVDDHERRLIKIEAKTGIAKSDGNQNVTAY